MVHHPLFDFTVSELAALRARPADVALSAAAVARDGVLSRGQLLALGLNDSAIARRVRGCRLHRHQPGVYAVGRADLSWLGELRAALLRCGRCAALSHRTSGWNLELLSSAGGLIHITTTDRRARPPRGSNIALHFTDRWLPGDVVWADGLPCTSVARTLADLAASSPRREFTWAWDDADQRRLLDVPSLVAQAERQRPGAGVLRARLARCEEAPPVGSPLEELFLAILRRAGVREPLREWPLAVEDRTGRVDFVFWPERVAIELDSRKWHEIQAAMDRDRQKDMALREAGFDPHRYGYPQVRDEGRRVAEIVIASLAAAQRRIEFA